MCLYACRWANLERVYFGCTIDDNAAIGFRDAALDELAGGRARQGDFLVCVDRAACLELFAAYAGMEHKVY